MCVCVAVEGSTGKQQQLKLGQGGGKEGRRCRLCQEGTNERGLKPPWEEGPVRVWLLTLGRQPWIHPVCLLRTPLCSRALPGLESEDRTEKFRPREGLCATGHT